MYNTKISMEEYAGCEKCGTVFGDEADIFRSDKSGKFYCRDCADEMKENSHSEKSVGYLRHYFLQGDYAVMCLKKNTLSILEDGFYRINTVYRTVEKLDDNDRLQPFKLIRIKDASIVEIRNGRPIWYFPGSEWVHKLNADIDCRTYREAFDYISPNMNIKHCVFLTLSDKIVGILSPYKMHNFDEYIVFGTKKELVPLPYEHLAKNANKSELSRMLGSALECLTPSVMLSRCKERIQGQPMIKNAVFIIYSYLLALEKGNLKAAENWLLTAPSGSGKTEFYRAIRDIFREYSVPVPVVYADLSLITEAGFKGDNVDTIRDKLVGADGKSDGYCICFLDEADKKFLPSHTSSGDDVNAAVQSNLLTMIEGMPVEDGGRTFDTSRTMFVFLGSFQDIRDKRQDKQRGKSLGFGTAQEQTADFTDVAGKGFYDDVTLQEMVDYGMKEELAGRITRVVNFGRIPEEQMRELIRYKTAEIAEGLDFKVEITDNAVEEFLATAYGTLGVRRPMNRIRELIQDAVADVFFNDDFDSKKITVVINSADKATVKKHTKERFIA